MSDTNTPVADTKFAKLRKQLKSFGRTLTDDPPPKYEGVDPLDPLGAEKIFKEVAKLAGAVGDIEIAFRVISLGFTKASTIVNDKEQDGASNRSAKLKEYKVRWDGFRETYAELIRESRRVAGNARAIALDFARDFLDVIKDEAYSIEKKKEEIVSYRESLQSDMQNGEKLSRGFESLYHAVKDFREEFSDYFKAWVAEEQTILDNLLEEIERVETGLLRARNIGIGATLGSVACLAGGVVSTFCGFFCPILWIWALVQYCIGGAAGAYAGYKFYELLKKKNALEALRLAHQKGPETVKQIEACFDDLKSNMLVVQKELAVFSSIWQTIHSDLQFVEENLKQASSTELRFRKKIETVSVAYETLARALRLYETYVHIKS